MLQIFSLLFIIPFIEVYLLLRFSEYVGFSSAILLVLGTGVVGVTIAKSQGFRTLAQIQGKLEQGIIPTKELVESFLLIVAGVLLIIPGILTDILGLILLIPFIRSRVSQNLINLHHPFPESWKNTWQTKSRYFYTPQYKAKSKTMDDIDVDQ